jgi:signal transduction histidine kinase
VGLDHVHAGSVAARGPGVVRCAPISGSPADRLAPPAVLPRYDTRVGPWEDAGATARRYGGLMRRPAPRTADLALALGLALALELELAVRDDAGGPALLNALAALALALPLAWRRSAPLVAVLGYAGTAAGQELAGGALFAGVTPPLFALIPGAVAFYSLGAHARGDREALAGALAGLAGLWTSVLLSGEIDVQSFVFPAGLIVAAPWLAGRARREREQREAAVQSLAASDERARIARELHDVVAHSVGVMVVQAQGARNVLDRDPERARQALDAIEETGRGALADVRRTLGLLRRPGADAAREPQPGVEDLAALVDQARGTGLAVELAVEGPSRPLPTGVDLSAYRIVQEALTNTIKHAEAANVRIAIRYGEDELGLEITDDGAKPAAGGGGGGDDDVGGHGLVGMRERVALFGGDLRAGPRRAGGFAVRARIPIEP